MIPSHYAIRRVREGDYLVGIVESETGYRFGFCDAHGPMQLFLTLGAAEDAWNDFSSFDSEIVGVFLTVGDVMLSARNKPTPKAILDIAFGEETK